MNILKLWTFAYQKMTLNNENVTNRKKVFATHMYEKGFMSRIYFLNKGSTKSRVLCQKNMQIIAKYVKNEQLSHQRSTC